VPVKVSCFQKQKGKGVPALRNKKKKEKAGCQGRTQSKAE
jgi:hypothetical protein